MEPSADPPVEESHPQAAALDQSKPLPTHLRTEVRMWTTWFGADRPLTAATPVDVARFYRDVLSEKSLTVRLSCSNALNEWYSQYLGLQSPFSVNPLPYNLLQKYAPMSFGEVVAWLRELAPEKAPERAWVALILLCRVKAQDVKDWTISDGLNALQPNQVRIAGRTIPITDETYHWLSEFRSPRAVRDVVKACPVKVTDLHLALAAELSERGVPEVTCATLYGRWSAMKVAVARSKVGLFRVALLPEPWSESP